MSASELLRSLLAAIEKHEHQHQCKNKMNVENQAQNAAQTSQVPSMAECRKLLNRVKTLLPSLVNTLSPKTSSRKLLPACELLKILLIGEFCPYASAVFEYGEVALVVPPFLRLIALFAEETRFDDLRVTFEDSIAALLGLLLDKNLTAFSVAFDDLIALLRDLRNCSVAIHYSLTTADQIGSISCFQNLTKCTLQAGLTTNQPVATHTDSAASPMEHKVNISSVGRLNQFQTSCVRLILSFTKHGRHLLAGRASFSSLFDTLCQYLDDELGIHSTQLIDSVLRTLETLLVGTSQLSDPSQVGDVHDEGKVSVVEKEIVKHSCMATTSNSVRRLPYNLRRRVATSLVQCASEWPKHRNLEVLQAVDVPLAQCISLSLDLDLFDRQVAKLDSSSCITANNSQTPASLQVQGDARYIPDISSTELLTLCARSCFSSIQHISEIDTNSRNGIKFTAVLCVMLRFFKALLWLKPQMCFRVRMLGNSVFYRVNESHSHVADCFWAAIVNANEVEVTTTRMVRFVLEFLARDSSKLFTTANSQTQSTQYSLPSTQTQTDPPHQNDEIPVTATHVTGDSFGDNIVATLRLLAKRLVISTLPRPTNTGASTSDHREWYHQASNTNDAALLVCLLTFLPAGHKPSQVPSSGGASEFQPQRVAPLVQAAQNWLNVHVSTSSQQSSQAQSASLQLSLSGQSHASMLASAKGSRMPRTLPFLQFDTNGNRFEMTVNILVALIAYSDCVSSTVQRLYEPLREVFLVSQQLKTTEHRKDTHSSSATMSELILCARNVADQSKFTSPNISILAGREAVSVVFQLPIRERLLVLASNLDFEDVELLSTSNSTDLASLVVRNNYDALFDQNPRVVQRAAVQISTLLSSLQITSSTLEAVVADSMSLQISQELPEVEQFSSSTDMGFNGSSAQLAVRLLNVMISLLSSENQTTKYGGERDMSVVTVDTASLQSALVYAICRLHETPIVHDQGQVRATCSFGEVPGVALFWKQVFKLLFSSPSPIEPSNRVCLVHGLCALLTKTVFSCPTNTEERISKPWAEGDYGELSELFSGTLALINDSESLVRKAIAMEFPLFLQSCCGESISHPSYKIHQQRVDLKPSMLQTPQERQSQHSCLYALSLAMGQSQNSSSLLEFMRYVSRALAAVSRNIDLISGGRNDSGKVDEQSLWSHRFSILEAIGSIGACVNQSFTLPELDVGKQIIPWALLELTREWLHAYGKCSSDAGSNVQHFKELEAVAQEQILRIARLQVRSASSRHTIAQPNVIATSLTHQLFENHRELLYPELFSIMFSAPLLTTCPRGIEGLVVKLLQVGSSSENENVGNQFGTKSFSNVRSRATNDQDNSSKVREFIENSLECILPSLLRNLNDHNVFIPTEIAMRLQPSQRPQAPSPLRWMLVHYCDKWIYPLVDMIANANTVVSSSASDSVHDGTDTESKENSTNEQANEWVTWRLILKHTSLKMKDIVSLGSKAVLTQVAIRLVNSFGNPDLRALKILSFLTNYSSSQVTNPISDGEQDEDPVLQMTQANLVDAATSNLLRNYFMYIMSMLTNQIRWESADKKNHALRCTAQLLNLIEGDIDMYFTKVMPTLKAALMDPLLQIAACDTLRVLLARLTVPLLCRVLGAVIVAVLPCLNVHHTELDSEGDRNMFGIQSISQADESNGSSNEAEESAVAIIHWLVVEREDELKPAFREAQNLMPVHPKLCAINTVLERHSGSFTLVEQLKQLANQVRENSEGVRRIALKELQRVLVSRAREIHQAVLAVSDGHTWGGGGVAEGATPFPSLNSQNGMRTILSILVGNLMWVNRVAGGVGGATLLLQSSKAQSSVPQNKADLQHQLASHASNNTIGLSSSFSGIDARLSASPRRGNSSKSSLEIRLACSACLGELSAIDPSRLDLEVLQLAHSGTDVLKVMEQVQNQIEENSEQLTNTRTRGSSTIKENKAHIGLSSFSRSTQIDVGNDVLVAEIIEKYLVDLLQGASNPATQLAASLAIQELLQFYVDHYSGTAQHRKRNRQDRGGASDGNRDIPNDVDDIDYDEIEARVSKLFMSPETLDVVRPLWKTRYELYSEWAPEAPRAKSCTRFFGPGVRFEKSVSSWFAALSQVSCGRQKSIFSALHVLCTLKSSTTDILLFVLPYLVQNVLCTAADDDRNRLVRDEVLSVLQDTWDQKTVEVEEMSKKDTTSSNLLGSGRLQLSTQTMFSLLDTLKAWHYNHSIALNIQTATASAKPTRSARNANPKGAPYGGDFDDKSNVGHFLSSIPCRSLALAAYQCGAHARALMQLEEHLRGARTGPSSRHGGISGVAPGSWLSDEPVQFDRDDIEFLNCIYSELETEPDGLVAITALRERHDGGPGTATARQMEKAKESQGELDSMFAAATTGFSTHHVYSLNFGWVESYRKRSMMYGSAGDVLQAGMFGNQGAFTSRAPKTRRSSARDVAMESQAGNDDHIQINRQPGDGAAPTLLEQINDFKRIGRWDEALSCFAQAIEQLDQHRSTFISDVELRARDVPQGGGEAHHDERTVESVTVTQTENSSSNSWQLAKCHLESLWNHEQTLHEGQLQCLRRAGHNELLVSIAEGKVNRNPNLRSLVLPYVMEAFWKLGKWDKLDQLLVHESDATCGKIGQDTASLKQLAWNDSTTLNGLGGTLQNQSNSTWSPSDFEIIFAKRGKPEGISAEFTSALAEAVHLIAVPVAGSENTVGESMSNPYGFSTTRHQRFTLALQRAQVEVMDLLAAASMESYSRAYPFLLRLHCLTELQHGWEVLRIAHNQQQHPASQGESSRSADIREHFRDRSWAERLKLTVANPQLQNQVLELRRIMFRCAGLETDVMKTWLHIAQVEKEYGDKHGCEHALAQVRACANQIRSACSIGGNSVRQGSDVHETLFSLPKLGPNDAKEAEAAVYHARIEHADLLRGIGKTDEHSGLDAALRAVEPVPLDISRRDATKRETNPILRRARAKALLYATNLMVETMQVQGGTVIERYRIVAEMRPTWEKAHFFLGKYYDLLLTNVRQEEDARNEDSSRIAGNGRGGKGDMPESKALLFPVIKQYFETLKCGNQHLFESLPRILTLWFTYGDIFWMELETLKSSNSEANNNTSRSRSSNRHKQHETNAPAYEQTKEMHEKLQKMIARKAKDVSAEQWLSVFPQLVSHICHNNPSVWAVMKKIIIRVIEAYPSQGMWQLMGVYKSKMASRHSRAKEVLLALVERGQSSGRDFRGHVDGTSAVFDALILLAREKNLSHPRRKMDVRSFLCSPMLEKSLSLCDLVVPTQAALSATMPAFSNSSLGAAQFTASTQADTTQASVPVAGTCSSLAPMLVSFSPQATVMSSKERPKKIQAQGSDGVARYFLCKNEHRGDLRKDSRMMEFNTVVNRLFNKDPHARRRGLRLRTYAVTCLNEECGLLEWVDNTEGFRFIVQRVYAQEGITSCMGNGLKEHRAALESIQNRRYSDLDENSRDYQPILEARRASDFRKEVLSHFPPMLHKWFLYTFTDPAAWLKARSLYIRSAAVWSMVGHIVGLGDRHAENCLVDLRRGELVHVDFDCLFDKGLSLGTPEIVPFRMTRNMVDGLDVAGVDGAFRTTSEVALGVLRANKDVLMGVLESFAVDPLVEWTRTKQNQGLTRHQLANKSATDTAEREQGKRAGQRRLRAVKERLDGIVRRKLFTGKGQRHAFDVLPLSTQGHVNRLIQEATAETNLYKMYSGWAPFL